ncbi:MAG: vWA domain-containing protein, partial [Candidatus Ranarchaeia archaeon]
MEEIDQHHNNPHLYARLAQRLQASGKLNYESFNRLTRRAIEKRNLSAIVGIARVNKYAVVNALQQDPRNATIIARTLADENSPGGTTTKAPIELYYLLRATAPPELKLRLKRIARQAIRTESRRISHTGLRPDAPRISPPPYEPGNDFDLDATLDFVMDTHPTALVYTATYHALSKGRSLPFYPPITDPSSMRHESSQSKRYVKPDPLTNDDILSIRRQPRAKAAILLLDTSGSMYGDKLPTAAITASVIAHHLRNDYYSIITFNRDATALKSFKQRTVDPEKLADSLLDLQPAGYTNIAAALRAAQKQLNYLRKIPGGIGPSPLDTWTILITDGFTNRGPNPEPLAKKMPILHVIQTPPPTNNSQREVEVTSHRRPLNTLYDGGHVDLQAVQVAPGETNPFTLVSNEQLDPAT